MQEKTQIKGRITGTIFWILAIMWMAFIFYMSAQTGTESADMSSPIAVKVARVFVPGFDDLSEGKQINVIVKTEVIIRKGAHLTEYAILGFLIYLVVQMYVIKKIYASAESWILATVYAASDEFHQMFVGGRSPQIRDVCIDSAGAVTGVLVCMLITFLILKLCNKKIKRKQLSEAVTE